MSKFYAPAGRVGDIEFLVTEYAYFSPFINLNIKVHIFVNAFKLDMGLTWTKPFPLSSYDTCLFRPKPSTLCYNGRKILPVAGVIGQNVKYFI